MYRVSCGENINNRIPPRKGVRGRKVRSGPEDEPFVGVGGMNPGSTMSSDSAVEGLSLKMQLMS